MSSNFDFAKASRSNFFDLDKLLFVSRDVYVGYTKALGWVDTVFDVIKGVVGGGFSLLKIADVAHQVSEISRSIALL